MKEYYLGIDIGGTKCAVILGTEDVRILERLEIPTDHDMQPEQFIKTQLIVLCNKLMDAYQDKGEIRAVGISCGGPLNDKTGVILSPPNLPGWNEIPITTIIQAQLQIPAYLQNDANACAMAEWKFGAGKGSRNMIFLTFGTGLGAGLILNGSLYSGANGMAGEVGHIRLSENGPTGYGKAGSFEGYCSGGGIKDLAAVIVREKTPQNSQFQKISDGEYIDEWGIRRVFTGLYWEAVNAPLKDAELEDLDSYQFPDPDSISTEELDAIERQAKELYENTDYVICGEHPVYGIFELGCWMCGFDEFLYKMAAEPEFVEAFFEKVLTYQRRVIISRRM